MERVLFCPQRFPTKSAAQKALGVEIRKAKETGHSPGWNMLKLYFCHECGSYHIWPRRPARAPERKVAGTQIPALTGQ
jgi:hypothetical protein